MIAFDENKFWRLFFLQSAVPGEDHAIFTASGANQPVTAQMGTVNDVLADDAEPLD